MPFMHNSLLRGLVVWVVVGVLGAACAEPREVIIDPDKAVNDFIASSDAHVGVEIHYLPNDNGAGVLSGDYYFAAMKNPKTQAARQVLPLVENGHYYLLHSQISGVPEHCNGDEVHFYTQNNYLFIVSVDWDQKKPYVRIFKLDPISATMDLQSYPVFAENFSGSIIPNKDIKLPFPAYTNECNYPALYDRIEKLLN